jgi:hypothetical protein
MRATLGGRSFFIDRLSPAAIRALAQIVTGPAATTCGGRLDQYAQIARIAIPTITDEEIGAATLVEMYRLRDLAFEWQVLSGFIRLPKPRNVGRASRGNRRVRSARWSRSAARLCACLGAAATGLDSRNRLTRALILRGGF